MQVKKYLLIGVLIFANLPLMAQDNGGCDDCPAFNANGKVEVRGFKERIIGDLSQSISERVKNLISEMTLEEKVAQLVSESDSIPRLNLPSYNYWNECLHGVARAGEVTVFPQAINLASTWDTLLIKKVASAISTEARLKYLEIGKGLTYWSPTINMARDPRWGRNEETYGEDPFLTSRLGVAFVKGLQGDHPDYLKTVATIKHFVANNQENDRFSSSSQIPTKQLYEYYFPAYEACVKEANAQSVMTAYNAFNGMPPSGSKWLLEDVLRKEWGFNGFVVSDCGAIGVMNWQHRVVNSLEEAAALGVNSGCDLECGGTYREKLVDAVRLGLISEKTIDKALTRILTARFRLGEFDPLGQVPYNHYDKSLLAGEQFAQLAYEAAVKSIVLLKNRDSFLPLNKKKIRSVAIVGPFGDNNYLGGYSGKPVHNISLLKGVRDLLGKNVKVSYMEGTSVIAPVDSECFLASDGVTPGLTADYITGNNVEDTPLFSRIDETVGFDWGDGGPGQGLPKENFIVRWRGFLKTPVEGKHTIGIYADGGVRVWLEGRLVLDKWDAHGLQFYSVETTFGAERKMSVRIEYINRTGASTCMMVSDFGNSARIREVKEFVTDADLVLVALGGDEKLARENRDLPSIYLPMTQELLLKEIYKVNPRTALIFHTGNPLTSQWVAEHIPAILQAWYPGQEAGRALANILFGLENPSGKLPMTIYESEEQLPEILDYDIWKGRTYQYLQSKPLYGFGHGLSYSKFEYSNLQNDAVVHQGDTLQCSIEIKNVSKMAGEEVVQVYISRENSPVYTFPLKKLVAFGKVALKPGESKKMNFTIIPRQLSVWQEGNWNMLPGKYTLFVGSGQQGLSEGMNKGFEIRIK